MGGVGLGPIRPGGAMRMLAQPIVSVVDDDASVREALPDLLVALGYTAQTFVSAEEFLASEAAGASACLILDVSLPGISGPDLQDELRRRGQNVPIIFVTANIEESTRQHVLARGAVACLFKPFEATALLEAL